MIISRLHHFNFQLGRDESSQGAASSKGERMLSVIIYMMWVCRIYKMAIAVDKKYKGLLIRRHSLLRLSSSKLLDCYNLITKSQFHATIKTKVYE